jgi:hypothetical protein
MANWYTASFKTTDKDIVNIIKNGQTMQFSYDEEIGGGNCDLKYGLCAIDLNKIEEIASKHKSNLHIIAYDIYTCTEQELEFKNGIETICESRHKELKLEEILN